MPSADAATGTLTINNNSYTDPSGKYWGYGGTRPGSTNRVTNSTDEPATVNAFQAGGETYLGTVRPGESRSFTSYTITVPIR